MKKLEEILDAISILECVGSSTISISGIESDSRKVEQDFLFVATCGTQCDGHDFIPAAITKGATAIVCENLPETINDAVTYIKVADANESLGRIASAWFDFPSSKLELIGVTGTNGKTTIATLLYQLFVRLGYKTGLLSTVCNCINQKEIPATHTTPDSISLNRLLAEMADDGCQYVFMEVSSHAVEQRRIAGLEFAGGVFTNLTRDHLDYHETFANYLKAKKRFFDDLTKEAFALTNLDDKNGLVMLQNARARKYTYSLRQFADFRAKILEDTFEGMLLEVNKKEVTVPFIGRFNASNLLAVFGAAVLLGQDEESVLIALSVLQAVSGRFEVIYSPSGYRVIVDYAHTPDALANVIHTINEIRKGEGRLITVVGCGGNRDKGKRPLMAQEAVKGSEQVVLTSDNPRNEDPQEIVNDMLNGLDIIQKKKVISILDRYQAIKTACALAQPGDVILVAGKGHENYQEVNGVKYHFDDKEIIKTMIND